jgi:hypothetical protein
MDLIFTLALQRVGTPDSQITRPLFPSLTNVWHQPLEGLKVDIDVITDHEFDIGYSSFFVRSSPIAVPVHLPIESDIGLSHYVVRKSNK